MIWGSPRSAHLEAAEGLAVTVPPPIRPQYPQEAEVAEVAVATVQSAVQGLLEEV